MTTAMKDKLDAPAATASRRLQYRLDKFREATSTSTFTLGSPVALGDAQLCVMLALQDSVERLVYRGALAGAAVETLTVGGLVCRLIDQAGREVGSANVGSRGAVTIPVQHEDIRSGVRCTLSLAVRDTPLAENGFWTHFASELAKAAAQLEGGGPPMKIPAIPATELELVRGQAVRVKPRTLAGASKDVSSTPESDSDSYLDASRRRFVFRLPCNDRTETGVFRIIAQDRDGRLIGSCRKTLEMKPSMRNPDGYWKGEAFPEEFLPAEWLERAQELHFYCVPENVITNADSN